MPINQAASHSGTNPSEAATASNVAVRWRWALYLCTLLVLGACGGAAEDKGLDVRQMIRKYTPSAQLAGICAAPQIASEEVQGSVADEKAWVRSFVDERYLWYRDVADMDAKKYASAADYFDVLKTYAKNRSGADLDRFHFSESLADAIQRQAGVALDNGIKWQKLNNLPPRNWVVYDVEPESAAGLAGVKRGDKLLEVDSVDFIRAKANTDVDRITVGLFPANDATHTLLLQRGGSNVSIALSVSQSYQTSPVRYAQIIDYQGKKMAYLYYDSFIGRSEDALIEAFDNFAANNVDELILDLRYNSGGLLGLSAQLAYMIVGSKSGYRIYSQNVFNDKRPFDTATSQNAVYQQLRRLEHQRAQ